MIEVIDLKKVFDNGFEALKSVNFTIEQGDLVCLLGPSGCGKSTILNLIAGLLHPSDGYSVSTAIGCQNSTKRSEHRVRFSKLCLISTYDCSRKRNVSFDGRK